MRYLVIIISVIFSFTLSLEAQNSHGNWEWGPNGWQRVNANHSGKIIESPDSDAPQVNNNSDSLVFLIDGVNQALLYLIDLDNNGIKEYVISCCRPGGQALICIFDENGNLYPGFPFIMPRDLSYPATVSMYDWGKLALTYCVGVNGYLLGINSSGLLEIPEVEISGSVSILSREPVVADITGDGSPDLILLFGNAPVNSSTLVFYDLRDQCIIHQFLLPYSQVTPAVGDIDGDGVNEVIHETGMFWDPGVLLWAFEGDGTLMTGWPKSFCPSTLFAGVYLADFVGDSRPEIVLQLTEYVSPESEYIRLISPDGQELDSFHFQPNHWGGIPMTAIGKMEDNISPGNHPILIQARQKWIYYTNLTDSTTECVTLDKVPDEIKTFRAEMYDGSSSTQLITAAVQTSSNYSTVNIIDADRNIVEQNNICPAADVQLADLTSNGYLDIVYTAFSSNICYVYALRDFYEYCKDKVEWPECRHDFGRTCNYEYNDPFTPVELMSFTSGVTGNSVNLFWMTATETNNAGFVVERFAESLNSIPENIGFVEGNGTTTSTHSYSYTDKNLSPGKYFYRLKQINFDGSYEYSKEIEVTIAALSEFVLEQNYPNPFNPVTIINYQLTMNNFVTLKLYNVLGEEVKTLVNAQQSAGRYEVKLDGSSLPSGVYIYRLSSGNYSKARKLILLK